MPWTGTSQESRDRERAAKPSRYQEFYNKDSYHQAIAHAIAKGNKVLPDNEQIPHWYPYQIRHTAATAMEKESGLDEAQALLDHSSAQTTKRYSHARLQKMKDLARNRRNPFDVEGQAESENWYIVLVIWRCIDSHFEKKSFIFESQKSQKSQKKVTFATFLMWK